MRSGFPFHRFVLFIVFFSFLSPDLARATWAKEEISANTAGLAIETVWGTSDSDIYALSFEGKVFHKSGTAWTDISSTLFTDASATLFYLPYGVWGTGPDNVYVVGSVITFPDDGTTTIDDALKNGTPFIFHYDGSNWSRISFTAEQAYALEDGPEESKTGKFKVNWLAGIWGTSDGDMYFSGGKFTGALNAKKEPVTGGIILHYSASEGWTGEVGVGDFIASDGNYTNPSTNPMPMVNEIKGINGQIYAVGLKGLILHKDIAAGSWDLMETETTALNFFRVWGLSKGGSNDVIAIGFNSSNSAAAIYRYDESDEKKWVSMTLPTLKTGYIAALWGIWGESMENVHCVGNTGASLYYDGNPGNIWKLMLSDTTTSLNCAWGTSFNNVYAAGEDGNLYHYTQGKKFDGIGVYPGMSVAPSHVEYTDISTEEIYKWEWDFGEGPLDPVAPMADLDYKILVTAVEETSLNGARIEVLDNGSATGAALEDVEAKSATLDLGDNPNTSSVSEGLILITAKPGKAANSYSIYVIESSGVEPAAIYRYRYGLYLKVTRETTLGEMADLIESLTDLVASAVPDNPDARWFDSNPGSSSDRFEGGRNYTIRVRIDSGVTTYQQIADLLSTHPKIESAVPDSGIAGKAWVRGAETYSNKADFSGGLDNNNVYVNTDTSIDNYYMAVHTYKKAGDYTAHLSVYKPDVPATTTIKVKNEYLPDIFENSNETMLLTSIPGTAMNKTKVTIRDGGPGCTPSLTWVDQNITLTLASGETKQSEAARLLQKHPYILGAAPSHPDLAWYCSPGGVDYNTFYNGLTASMGVAEKTIKVLAENPLDFEISPSVGTKTLTAVFRETADDVIHSKIAKWQWYFNITVDDYGYINYGNASNGEIVSFYNRTNPSFTYNSIGTYNVMLRVLLDDNSPFDCAKDSAILVKSADEGKNSLHGGSGLDSVSGCFVGTIL
jgi:PKD repeat protein